MRGPHELVERLVGCDLDHPPEHVGRHAVVPALPRIRQQRQVGHPGREVFEPLGLGEQTRFVVEPVDGRVAGEPVGQARRVGQQMLDGDRAVRRHPVAVRHEHGDIGELRHELRERIVQRRLSLFDQDHHRHTGDRFRHREDAKDVVRLERVVAGAQIPQSDRVPVHYLTLARDHRHHAGQAAVVDVGLHGGSDPRQPVRRHADVGGAGGR